MNNFKITVAKIIVENLVSPQNKKGASITVEWILKNFGDEIEGIAINSALIGSKSKLGRFDYEPEEEEVKYHFNSMVKKVQKKWDELW